MSRPPITNAIPWSDAYHVINITRPECLDCDFEIVYSSRPPGRMMFTPRDLVASWRGGLATPNFEFGKTAQGAIDKSVITVAIDTKSFRYLPPGSPIHYVITFFVPDSHFPDGYNNIVSEGDIFPTESGSIYSQVVLNALRGNDGVITESQVSEIKQSVVSQITQMFNSGTLPISIASIGLSIDTTNNTMTFGGKTYKLTENVTVTSTTYSNPTVSLSYADIAASGGSVSPRLTYSQTKTITYSDGTSATSTISTGATIVYTDDNDIVVSNGNVTAVSSTVTTRHRIKTITVSVTMNGKETTKTVDVYQSAYVAPATAYDFRIGQYQSNASGFTSLSDEEIAASATKVNINANKTASFTATKSCVFVLIPTSHSHLSLSKFQYTSGGMTTNIFADNSFNLSHTDVTIDGTTYKVYGYRSGGITDSDPLTFDYSVTYNA